jgi:undecaprenyl-diphosphatase
MNHFDIEIISIINQFAQFSWLLDSTIKFISGNYLIKGGVLLTIFWWGWFRINKNKPSVQLHLLATLFSCVMALVLARSLTLLLPFRLRPLHEKSLDFILPYTMKPTALEGWSSFPSDHAVLFYALSTGFFYISKKVGIFAFAYTTLFIGFPRIYLGLHYPTDILGGALIGIVITLLCQSNYFLKKVSQPILNTSNTKPGIFYPLFFILTYQIADMFDNSRALFSFLRSAFKAVLV